jgi:hypothetical protein
MSARNKLAISEGRTMQEAIEIGYQTFVSDGGEEFGAVREVSPNGRPELVIYVENAGEFVVPLSAVEAVHSQKVILNCAKLERRLRRAIGHAHDAEEPDA